MSSRGIYQDPKTRTWSFTHQGALGADGKWQQVHRRGFKTRREAEKARALSIARMELGHGLEANSITLGEYLEKWLTDYLQVSAKTADGYAGIIRRHITPNLGHIRLQALTAHHIQEYYQELLAGGRLGNGRGRQAAGLSPRTVLHHHWVIVKALNYAVTPLRLITQNPADRITPPRPETKRPQTLTLPAVQHLLESLRGSELYMPTVLAVATGMRAGEILALRWEDVDLATGVIKLSESVTFTRDTGLQRKGTKTGRGRNIPLPGFALTALLEHRSEQNQRRQDAGDAWEDHGLVCPRSDGRPDRNPAFFANRFRCKMIALKIPITFHGLRHTHATLALELNIHPKVVSERLGHSRIGTTLDIYSRVVPSMQADAAARIDEAFRKREDR